MTRKQEDFGSFHFPIWNLLVYKVGTESIQPCNMKNGDIYWRRYTKHCTQDSDALVPFIVGTLGPHTILPASLPLFKTLQTLCWNRHRRAHCIFLNCINSLTSLPFQRVIWVLAGSHRASNLGSKEAKSPGWFDVSPKTTWVAAISSYCISQPMKNIEIVLLINCLAQRGKLMMDNTFPIKKHS